MTEADRTPFGILIEAAAAQFRVEVTEALLEGYWLGLCDLPLDKVREAIGRGIRGCRFMPTANELRNMAGDLQIAERAIRAWHAVTRAMSAVGEYQSVDFDDPLSNATLRMLGGWVRCCEYTGDELHTWLRKEFIRTYESLGNSGVGPDLCRPLGGIHSQNNAAKGLHDKIPAPRRIQTGLPPHRPELAAPKREPSRLPRDPEILRLVSNIGRPIDQADETTR